MWRLPRGERSDRVIEAVAIPFEPGLNVLTGETGAGKSILIDALENRLGDGRVYRLAARESYIPERAVKHAPVIPETLKENGLEKAEFILSDEMLTALIQRYTREVS